MVVVVGCCCCCWGKKLVQKNFLFWTEKHFNMCFDLGQKSKTQVCWLVGGKEKRKETNKGGKSAKKAPSHTHKLMGNVMM